MHNSPEVQVVAGGSPRGASAGAVGAGVPNIDALQRVTGKAVYAGDLRLPGMAYAKIIRSPIAHGTIVEVDASAALRVPGVRAVLTAADCPDAMMGAQVIDECVLARHKVRFAGDEVAVVVAVDEELAEEAAGLVRVEYDELPSVFDPLEAMLPGAPLLHECPDNVAFRTQMGRGDVDAAFAEADYVSEHEYKTNLVYQAYMEPNAAVANIDATGRVVLYSGMQDPSAARPIFAHALGISPARLRIVQMDMGGGFGGKLQPKTALLCALAALRTGHAVKLINQRHEDFHGSQPRVPMIIKLKLGARRNGLITAKDVHIVADNGAYTRKGTSILVTALHRVDALYAIANLRAAGELVYTNKMPTAAFRGYGNGQMHFAMESELDDVADALGLDPVEVRLKNGSTPGTVNPYGWKINSCGLSECIGLVTRASGWREKHKTRVPGKGMGIGCCVHVSGNRAARKEFDGSAAVIRIDTDGTVIVYSGEADMGQGARTVFAQIAAETLTVPIDRVIVAPIDTDTSPLALGTYASRVTYLGGNAVKNAAEEARTRLLDMAVEELDRPLETLVLEEGTVKDQVSGRSISIAALVEKNAYRSGGAGLTVTGSFVPDVDMPDALKQGNISGAYPYAAQVVDLDVDSETGRVTLNKIWAAHDLGRAINPVMSEGQVEGGVAMGIGWALMENMVLDDGRLVNDQFLDYVLPGAMDVPDIDVFLVESMESTGPFGAKSLGEPSIIPIVPAIASAIHEAVGVRIRELPITPEKLLAAIRERRADTPEGRGAHDDEERGV